MTSERVDERRIVKKSADRKRLDCAVDFAMIIVVVYMVNILTYHDYNFMYLAPLLLVDAVFIGITAMLYLWNRWMAKKRPAHFHSPYLGYLGSEGIDDGDRDGKIESGL